MNHMGEKKTIGLFVTCPVDIYRPSVGFATVTLLEELGYSVEVPPQTCCGQLTYNNGAAAETRKIAWQLVQSFNGFDYVVLPSGSCTAMITKHYPTLFEGDERQSAVTEFCKKVYELTSFLTAMAHEIPSPAKVDLSDKVVTYHDSCSGLRELGIKQQPRDLLKTKANVSVQEMQDTEVCCGFGGTFCVKFPDVSNRMVGDKVKNAAAQHADLLLGGDLSCLLNIAGKAKRDGVALEVRHIAEVLAGQLDEPGIGDAPDSLKE